MSVVTLSDVLQRAYAAEINLRVESFFDSGYEAFVGDEINGWWDTEPYILCADHPDALADAVNEYLTERSPRYRHLARIKPF